MVLNAELIIQVKSKYQLDKGDSLKRAYAELLKQAKGIDLILVSILDRQGNEIGAEVSEPKKHYSASKIENRSALESNLEWASGTESFVRLSSFEKDKRIDYKNKRLLPGSYATSLNDYQICKAQNENPVERYALPTDDTIKWAFHITPSKTDSFKRGLVQPANGRKGGGVEAFFENGTANNTFVNKTAY